MWQQANVSLQSDIAMAARSESVREFVRESPAAAPPASASTAGAMQPFEDARTGASGTSPGKEERFSIGGLGQSSGAPTFLAGISDEVIAQLERERGDLVMKKYSPDGLSAQEEKRLRYLSWQVGRLEMIRDAPTIARQRSESEARLESARALHEAALALIATTRGRRSGASGQRRPRR